MSEFACEKDELSDDSIVNVFRKKKLPTVPETILKRRKEKSERREKQLKAQLTEKKVRIKTT